MVQATQSTTELTPEKVNQALEPKNQGFSLVLLY